MASIGVSRKDGMCIPDPVGICSTELPGNSCLGWSRMYDWRVSWGASERKVGTISTAREEGLVSIVPRLDICSYWTIVSIQPLLGQDYR